jgi:hypothetical protein
MIISPHYFSWVSKMNADKLEKKQIVREIDHAIQTGFSIDTSHDEEFLKTSEYSWEDLNKLKEDLGSQIVQFIAQVQEVITNPAIIQNLGDKADHFNKVVELFFSDINNFSFKVKDIRVLHEHLSGRIETMTDFNNYNRIAIQYQSLFSELATLITPTLGDLMMTVTEIIPVNVVESATPPAGAEQKGDENV